MYLDLTLQVRKDFEGLQPSQEGGRPMQSSLKHPAENFVLSDQVKDKWEKGHKEATLELLKVKDRAIELERNVSVALPNRC